MTPDKVIGRWLGVPDPTLATSDASYAIVGHQGWKEAYIGVVELGKQTCEYVATSCTSAADSLQGDF